MLRLALALTLAAALVVLPTTPVAADEEVVGGSVSGVAAHSGGSALGNYTVRIRNVDSGQLAGTALTNAAGQYSFASLPAGSYVVELTNGTGAVIGTSPVVTLARGASVAGVTVAPSAASSGAIAGGVGGGSFFKSTSGIVVMAAAGGGIGALAYKLKDDASPSK
jgi:hypothetical protein